MTVAENKYNALVAMIRSMRQSYSDDLENENFGINRTGDASEQRMWSRFDGALIAMENIENYADSLNEAWGDDKAEV